MRVKSSYVVYGDTMENVLFNVFDIVVFEMFQLTPQLHSGGREPIYYSVWNLWLPFVMPFRTDLKPDLKGTHRKTAL